MLEKIKCQKCGKNGQIIICKTSERDKSFILCDECLAGLNKIIEIWLEVKRNVSKNLQEM